METQETARYKVHVLKRTKFVPLMDHVQVRNIYSLEQLENLDIYKYFVCELRLMTDLRYLF